MKVPDETFDDTNIVSSDLVLLQIVNFKTREVILDAPNANSNFNTRPLKFECAKEIQNEFEELDNRLEDNVDNDLIEEYDDYVMDEVEDEEDETEFYFDEIIDKFKFSDHNEVLHEDSLETVDPNLENSSIIAPNLEELAESSECFDNIKDTYHYLLKTSDPLANSN